MAAIGLECLRDPCGSVILGWLDSEVLYARFEQTISAELGARFAGRFTSIVGDTDSVRYFADLVDLASCDLLAIAMIVDAALSKRQQFKLIVTRIWSGAISPRALAFADAFGCVEYVTSAAEFDVRLKAATLRGVDELNHFRASLLDAELGDAGTPHADAVQTLETDVRRCEWSQTPRLSTMPPFDRRG